MDDLKFLILYGVLAGVLFASFRKAFHDPKLDQIPVVGSSGFLASYWDAFNSIRHSPDFIQRGYELYPDGIFRVARLFQWEYVVCGPKLTKDVASAPEHIISFNEGIEEDGSHWAVTSVNSEASTLSTILMDRVRKWPHLLLLRSYHLELDWKTLPVLPTMMAIVARRQRNFRGSTIPPAANNFTLGPYETLTSELQASRTRGSARALQFLGPLIEERLSKERELGRDWPADSRAKNDLVSWILDLAENEQRAVFPITVRILHMNMAAIHTTSTAATYAIFDLMTRPEYLLPMREEAERVVKEKGWTKTALNNMVKIDSFLRESQRLNTNGPAGMWRKVVAKDGFRFSDDTVLPYGTFLSVALRPTHYDESNYENAATFDGFRFARERAEYLAYHDPNDNQDIFKRHMISTAVDHMPFGTGKHACPASLLHSPSYDVQSNGFVQGRFFAATELKAIMAHLVINYDVEAEGVRPADKVFGALYSPDADGKRPGEVRTEVEHGTGVPNGSLIFAPIFILITEIVVVRNLESVLIWLPANPASQTPYEMAQIWLFYHYRLFLLLAVFCFGMDSVDTLAAMVFGRVLSSQLTDAFLLVPFAILCFDHLLTLEHEFNYVWRKPKRLSFFLFIVLRYMSLLSSIAMLVLRLGPAPLKYQLPRNIRGQLRVAYSPMCSGRNTDILGLRVYAMYNFSKRVLLFLVTIGVVTTALAAVLLIYPFRLTGLMALRTPSGRSQEIGLTRRKCRAVDSMCPRQAPQRHPLFCDVTVFVFTVVRSYNQPIRVPGSILTYLLRDGTLYFAAFALVNLANILMFHPYIASSLSWFTSTLSTTMASRLMLHLHRATDLGVLTHVVETSIHFNHVKTSFMLALAELFLKRKIDQFGHLQAARLEAWEIGMCRSGDLVG
ncbi:cytochrome P450 [Mycena olivaceomarginata]|nr:cytochrome P450 [Mycena olivaceomarginata]